MGLIILIVSSPATIVSLSFSLLLASLSSADLARWRQHADSFFGFPMGGKNFSGNEEDKAKILKQYNRKVEFSRLRNSPIWNGEFIPLPGYCKEKLISASEQVNSVQSGQQKSPRVPTLKKSTAPESPQSANNSASTVTKGSLGLFGCTRILESRE